MTRAHAVHKRDLMGTAVDAVLVAAANHFVPSSATSSEIYPCGMCKTMPCRWHPATEMWVNHPLIEFKIKISIEYIIIIDVVCYLAQ